MQVRTRHMDEGMPSLQVEGLAVAYDRRLVFSDLNLQIGSGESVALVGPSGAGKTTLLNTILGSVPVLSGSVWVAGREVTGVSASRRAHIRATSIGIVFQHGELLGDLSPVENVALPALIAGRPAREAFAAARAILDALEVPTERATADHLSGGERQRTSLARALINKPALVLADEPTGALDPETRDRIADVVFSAPQHWGCGLLVVTHDQTIAARADRVENLADIARLGVESVVVP